MRHRPPAIFTGIMQVNVGVMHGVIAHAGPGDKICDRMFGFIAQAMGIGHASRPTGAIAGVQGMRAVIFDQRHGAVQNIQELILRLMPVTLTRLRAGHQGFCESAELRQTAFVRYRLRVVHAEIVEPFAGGTSLTYSRDRAFVQDAPGRGGRIIRLSPNWGQVQQFAWKFTLTQDGAIISHHLPCSFTVDLASRIVRITAHIPRHACANDKVTAGRIAAIGQMMPVRLAMWPADSVAGAKIVHSLIVSQGNPTVEHINELIFVRVPVSERRPCTGGKRVDIGPKLANASRR